MLGTAVCQIVAIDRRDHHMRQTQLGDSLTDMLRLIRIEWCRHACLYVAEGASPRACVAHDHEGGVLLLPALANIRTARLFADCNEAMLPDDLLRFGPFR